MKLPILKPDGFGGFEQSGLFDLRKAVLTTKGRAHIATHNFAIPEDEAYPIHDEAHAHAALQRVSQHGTDEEKHRVRAAVKRKYPHIEVEGLPKTLHKAVAGAVIDAGPIPTWSFGAYTFKFRKGQRGLGVLSIEGGNLPLPYHMVIGGGEGRARRMALEAVSDFEAGRSPQEGVFRRELVPLVKGEAFQVASLFNKRMCVRRLVKSVEIKAHIRKGPHGAELVKQHTRHVERADYHARAAEHHAAASASVTDNRADWEAHQEAHDWHKLAQRAHAGVARDMSGPADRRPSEEVAARHVENAEMKSKTADRLSAASPKAPLLHRIVRALGDLIGADDGKFENIAPGRVDLTVFHSHHEAEHNLQEAGLHVKITDLDKEKNRVTFAITAQPADVAPAAAAR